MKIGSLLRSRIELFTSPEKTHKCISKNKLCMLINIDNGDNHHANRVIFLTILHDNEIKKLKLFSFNLNLAFEKIT